MVNDRVLSYQNIYEILMDNVRKAKEKLAPIGQVNGVMEEETDRRIMK